MRQIHERGSPMRRCVPLLAVLLLGAGTAHGRGLLIPEDKNLPPLAMLNHKVSIAIDDQVAVTKVEQTFRNHTDRPLEATYVFPVPKGASVNQFTMWADGKEVKGELVEAAKAREIYTAIVRRTQDPGLLEYIYPLKTDGKATATLEGFAIEATIKSQHAVQNVYSPTHAVTLKRANDK